MLMQNKNGNKKHIEFYYGSTYLSQSSRKFELTEDVNKIIITDFKGGKREVMNK